MYLQHRCVLQACEQIFLNLAVLCVLQEYAVVVLPCTLGTLVAVQCTTAVVQHKPQLCSS